MAGIVINDDLHEHIGQSCESILLKYS